jgi:arsenite methyltransferase
MGDTMTEEKIKQAVRQSYGQLARRYVGEAAPTRCCGPQQSAEAAPEQAGCCASEEKVNERSGPAVRLYSSTELAGLPDSVTGASAGCGNPTAIAELQPGEVVLDLGSGGGIDCFLAAQKVGPMGRVIGLDMTPDMIRLAQSNAKKMGVRNVEFRYGEMEDIPLPDETVDVIISNCVINLSPDKDAVFAEAFRVLRPGGRMSISDIVIDGDLPAAIRGRLDAWAGCIAGALDESDYLGKMLAAGFTEVEVASRDYAQISSAPGFEEERAALLSAGLSVHDLDHKVASVKIRARKPEAACCPGAGSS